MAMDLSGKELPQGIYQRADGLYRGKFQYKGESYTFYNRDLKAIKQEMKDKRYEIEHGLYAKQSNITVNSWYKVWLEEYKKDTVKYGTYATYEKSYELHIKKPLGSKKLSELRPEHIQRLFNDLAKTYSRKTISLVKIVLYGMCKQAVINGILPRNPVEYAMLPREKAKKEFRVLTVEEQKIFLEHAGSSVYYNAYVVLLGTGMRAGELRALQKDDLDFKNKVIHVRGTMKYLGKNNGYRIDPPKTSSSNRDIPMLDKVCQALKTQNRQQAERKLFLGSRWQPDPGLDNLVFTNLWGQPISHMALNEDINHIEQEITGSGQQFEHIKPHTLRHTFATRGLENGIPPKVMQELLGHTSITMTLDIYSHVLPDMKADEIQKLAGMI